MTSARSASERRPEDRLHRGVQGWLHEQGWRSLRPVQIAALAPVLGGTSDVIVTAPTAGGKTEAAFLPICSALATQRDAGTATPGVKVLYVSPLKALINDQFGRLELLCRHVDVPVHRWHGDVAASAKTRVRRSPDGIVIITPESLEALFVTGGTDVERILGGLRYVVVDELHAFLGSERGAQLQSLLHRVEVAVQRRVPRVALSATLADAVAARDFLRPGGGEDVRYLDPGGSAEFRLRVYGYVDRALDPDGDLDDEEGSALATISNRLYELRGRDNLVFANSRGNVEKFSDRLARLSDRARVPLEFLPHHGDLSKEMREHVEARLKDAATPTTAICTSTLEMGIDIGSVDEVAQVGAPPGAAALRQRLGRSGRRGDAPPTLRIHVPEAAPDPGMKFDEELRTQIAQTTAMVELMVDKWLEPPNTSDLHLSTLIQQVLSVIAQEGGASAGSLYGRLCGRGPFRRVTPAIFASLLRAMGASELIAQTSDGLLLAGRRGDRIVNHFSFYAAFQSTEEFRVVAGTTTLGTLPVDRPISVGNLLIFAGRRWRVLIVDVEKRIIALAPSTGGKVRPVPPGGPLVADAVRRRMRTLYADDRRPSFLDDIAATLLDQGRAAFARLRLAETALVERGADTVLVPWRGDTVMNTLTVLLRSRGLAVEQGGVALTVTGTAPDGVRDVLGELASAPPVDAVELAAGVAIKQADKYDRYLSPDLLARAYAARSLDIPNTWHALRELAGEPVTAIPRPRLRVVSTGRQIGLGVTPFAVLDVETTGFDPLHHDRIVEIAISRLSPEGDLIDSWTTLVDPARSPGPTQVHGITAEDLRGAPTFADIADEVARRLDGAVVVAHNADYDLRFLAAEFGRLGREVPVWPALCTLALSYLTGSASSRRLSDLCEAEGLPHTEQHSALGDVDATAGLLGVYLHRAAAGGATSFEELGVTALALPATAPVPPVPAPVKLRATAGRVTLSKVLAPATGDPRVDTYLSAMEATMADHVLDEDETARMQRLAEDLGLARGQISALHDRVADPG